MIKLGVHVLRNSSVEVSLGDGEIRIVVVDDPTLLPCCCRIDPSFSLYMLKRRLTSLCQDMRMAVKSGSLLSGEWLRPIKDCFRNSILANIRMGTQR